MTNHVDPDQLTSDGASWPGSTLFSTEVLQCSDFGYHNKIRKYTNYVTCCNWAPVYANLNIHLLNFVGLVYDNVE